MDPSSQSEYQLFQKWFTQNGGLHKKIIFPTRFPPTNYIGISASQDINQSQVILAVPKKLILSPSKARRSDLNSILEKYGYNLDLTDQVNESSVLLLYLIWQKIMGERSFFYPYFQVLGQPETLLLWDDSDIQKLGDPYITGQYVNEQKSKKLYKKFYQISTKHPELFPTPITQHIFKECQALMSSRCFGWGCPETHMMVPYADFLNHDCHGVYNYGLNKTLESTEIEQFKQEYIKKNNHLDLSLLGIAKTEQNKKMKSESCRQKFIRTHQNLLKESQISSDTHAKLNTIQQELLQQNYDVDLYPSSNSEDNDSGDDQNQSGIQSSCRLDKMQLKILKTAVKNQIQKPFVEIKPCVNVQFGDDVTFQWWNKTNEADNYFIVAAHKGIRKGQQVYNSYGRRNNKFLLIWYGFTLENNKYDSVAFRLWEEDVGKKTGNIIWTKLLTEKDLVNGIVIGNQRLRLEKLTKEFRLKKDKLNYYLMAYLRHRIVRSKQKKNNPLPNQLNSHSVISDIKLQKKVLKDYSKVLHRLNLIYQTQKERKIMSTPAHNHYASILQKSNREILENHQKGIQFLNQILQKIENGSSLMEAYRSNVTKEQSQAASKSADLSKRVRYQNRKFVLDYIKLLANFVK